MGGLEARSLSVQGSAVLTVCYPMWDTLWTHEKGAFPLSPELSSLELLLCF